MEERKLTDKEERIAQSLPDAEFKKRYGKDWKSVKIATATKMAKMKEATIRKFIKEQIKSLAEAEVKGDIVNLHYKIDVYAPPSDGDMSSVIDYVQNNEVVNKYGIKVEVGALEAGPKEDESSVYVKFTIDRRKTAAMTAIRLLRDVVIEFVEKKIGAVAVDIEAKDFKPDGPSDAEYDQMAQQAAMDDRRQQGLDPGLEEVARDLGYLNELNSYEMGKLPDFELLRKNVSQMLGVEVDDDVRSGMYNGREGYYSRISRRDLINWDKEQVEKLKQAFKKTNSESDNYEFEYEGVSDFEVEAGERDYPASFNYFATEKKPVKESQELKLGVKYDLEGKSGYIMTGGSKDPKDWIFSISGSDQKLNYLTVKNKLTPSEKQPGKYDGAFDLGQGKGHHIDESKLLDRIKEKPTVEERTAVLKYWLAKSPSRSQLPNMHSLTKEDYEGNDPLILSYIEKMDQDIPFRILRQEDIFFKGELIRMLNLPDDQEYIQDWENTLEINRTDPFGNKLTPQNHDYIADFVKANPDLAESKTLKEMASELGYLNEITISGGQEAARNYPPTEDPGDMFAQKEVEELLPASFASRNQELKEKIQAHANWAKQGQYNNTFVKFQVDTVTDGNNMYLIAMSQHYNHNYTDFKNPRFTEIRVKELDDESDMERDLGLYVVDTTALMQDLEELKTIKTVS